MLAELSARIQRQEKIVLRTSGKAVSTKPQVGRMIDAYDDAVRGFRETGRANPQLCLFTAEQLRKLF